MFSTSTLRARGGAVGAAATAPHRSLPTMLLASILLLTHSYGQGFGSAAAALAPVRAGHGSNHELNNNNNAALLRSSSQRALQPDIDSDTLYSYGKYDGGKYDGELGKCRGDCKIDANCRGDLECYEVEGTTSVPGCKGTREEGVDYCFDPNDLANENEAKDVPPNSDKVTFVSQEPSEPIGRCQGDCDDDTHCRDSLICFSAANRETSVPGCDGTRYYNTDYCIDYADLPREGKKLIRINEEGTSPMMRLGRCLGNCETDSDCLGGLECYDPKGDDEVPGCKDGKVDKGIRYCVGDVDDERDATYEPTAEPTAEPTYEPTADTTSEPTATAEPSPGPTAEGDDEEPRPEPNDTETETEVVPTMPAPAPVPVPATPPPPVSPGERPAVQTGGGGGGKVFLQLSPFVVELSFLTPPERRRRRLASAAAASSSSSSRNVLINDGIDERDTLLDVIASHVGESIRSLDPDSYSGLVLDAAFLDEATKDVDNDNANGITTTTVSYEFVGKAIFENSAESRHPSSDEMEVATISALEGDAVLESLRRSDDSVLQTVNDVSVYVIEEQEEQEAGPPPDPLSNQEGDTGDDGKGGVTTGVIVLIVLIVCCAGLIGGGYVYAKKKNIKPRVRFWKKHLGQRNDDYNTKSGGMGGHHGISSSVVAMSTRIMTSLPSPARTKSTFDSQDNNNPARDNNGQFVELDSSASELGVPNFDETSSIGGGAASSDWSFNGHALSLGGHSNSGSSSHNNGSRMPADGPLARASAIPIADTLIDGGSGAMMQEPAAGYDSYSEASYSTTDNMSALGEVRLGSVLQIDDEGLGGITEEGGDGGRNATEQQMDFQQVWRKSRRDQELSIEEQIFGKSGQVSMSQSADAEEILTGCAVSTGRESPRDHTPERTSNNTTPPNNPEEERPH